MAIEIDRSPHIDKSEHVEKELAKVHENNLVEEMTIKIMVHKKIVT